jgi:hypothetical protein
VLGHFFPIQKFYTVPFNILIANSSTAHSMCQAGHTHLLHLHSILRSEDSDYPCFTERTEEWTASKCQGFKCRQPEPRIHDSSPSLTCLCRKCVQNSRGAQRKSQGDLRRCPEGVRQGSLCLLILQINQRVLSSFRSVNSPPGHFTRYIVVPPLQTGLQTPPKPTLGCKMHE